MSNNPGNDVTNLALRLAVDEATLARSQQGLNLLSQRLQNLRSDTRAAGADIKTSLGGVADGIAKATPLMDRLAQASKQAAEEAKKAAGNWNDLRDSLNSAGGSGGGSGGGGFGVEGLRRTGSALSQVGLGAVGNPVRVAGDFAQIGKEFKLLGDAAGPLAQSMQGLPGIFGVVATEGVALGGAMGGVLAVAAPLALAIGAVALAFKHFITDTIDQGKKDLDNAVASQLEINKAKETLTTEGAQAQLKILKDNQSAIEATYNQLKAKYDALSTQRANSSDPIFNAAAKVGMDALAEQMGKLKDEFDKGQPKVDAYTQAINNNAFAAQDAAEQLKHDTEGILMHAKLAGEIRKQDYADGQLSVDAAKKKAEALKVNLDAMADEYNALVKSGNETKEVVDREQALWDSMHAGQEELDKLNQIFIPAAENAKKLADAEAKRKKNTEELIKAEEKNNQDIANTYKKYKDDVASIEQKSAEERASINKKLADTLVAEAQKALEQSQDALRKLEDKRADLLADYNKGELDAQQKAAYDDQTLQINAQREEVKAYQEHLQRLDDIRKSEWANEQQALLDRNFVALAKSRLTVATNMNQENTSFGRSQQDRAATLAASKQDAERQRAVEHQQRLEAYNQANADANKQYQRELRDQQIARERAIAAAQKAHDEDLKMLAQKTRAELDARAKAEKAELEIMIKGAKARVELEAKTQEALLNEAKAFAGARISTNAANPHSGTQFNLNLGQYARRAGGGPLSAGQPAIVNDGSGREAFNGQLLPGGAGIFYPLKSGVVSGATGGTQFHQENHISGVSDPKAVADMIKQQTVTLLEQVLNG